MARDLTTLSMGQIAEMTGKSGPTIAKRLKGLEPVGRRGNAILYKTAEALPMVYATDKRSAVAGAIDINDEKARTEKNRADKLEMENAVRRGELVERDEVLKHLQKSFAAVRSKLLAIPTKAAPVIITLGEATLAQDTLKKFVYDALDELTQWEDDEGVE